MKPDERAFGGCEVGDWRYFANCKPDGEITSWQVQVLKFHNAGFYWSTEWWDLPSEEFCIDYIKQAMGMESRKHMKYMRVKDYL